VQATGARPRRIPLWDPASKKETHCADQTLPDVPDNAMVLRSSITLGSHPEG
jgi:hypothetical protein